MKGKTIIKRLTLYSSMITLLFVLSSSVTRKRTKDFFINTTKITRNKIEYNSGTIYIGGKYYLSKHKDHGQNDVLALDARHEKDPDIRIYDSYMINDDRIMEEVVEALLLYEEKYPSKWDRTKNSMIREWIAHNAMYRLGYKVESSEHVDFNNDDEDVFILKKRITLQDIEERK